MYFPLKYRKIAHQRYSVYLSELFIGEVSIVHGAWYFRTFSDPAFVSPVPAYTRGQAVLQWSGLYNHDSVSAENFSCAVDLAGADNS